MDLDEIHAGGMEEFEMFVDGRLALINRYIPADKNQHAYTATTQTHGYSGHGSDAHPAGPAKSTVERDSGRKFNNTSVLTAYQPKTAKTSDGIGKPAGAYRPPVAKSVNAVKPRPAVVRPSPVQPRPPVSVAHQPAPRPEQVIKPAPRSSPGAYPVRPPAPVRSLSGSGHTSPLKSR